METNSLANHLIGLSQRLSVNTPFEALDDCGNTLNNEQLLKIHYKDYHKPSVKTFDEAAKSPFFKLLVENLHEGFKELPGWTNWILLEYYDEAVNGLRLVLITDKKNGYTNDQVEKLNQDNHNLSLLLRAIRELHIHIHGWHYMTDFNDKIYHAENKLALDKMLPESNNPYFNKQATDNHYKASHKPILISKNGEESDFLWPINRKEHNIFVFASNLNGYFELVKKINENGNLYNKLDNPELNENILDSLNQKSYNFGDTSRLQGKTFKKIAESIKEKFDRIINNIVVDKKIKPIALSYRNFSDYCGRLCDGFKGTDEFLYLPVFTTLKKGKEPQRKDLQIGSVLIGINGDNSVKSEDIHALWRFVQTELLKWYNQYSSFVLYSANVQLKKEALLNAITQVFARNESHINGSHVIHHYLTKNTPVDNTVKAYLKYLQERMELVASVQNFPGFIKEVTNLKTVVERFQKNKVLIEGIVEGKCAFKPNDNFNKGFCIGNQFQMKDFHLPGAAIGEQLFYALLEGILRNFIKHDADWIKKNAGADGLKISFKIRKITDKKVDEKIRSNFLTLDIWGNVDSDMQVIASIESKLNEKVLDNNRLRSHNLGMIELKAASLLLMDTPLSEIDNFNTRKNCNHDTKLYPPSIAPGLYDSSGTRLTDEKGLFGYRLYLLIPKLVYYTDSEKKSEIEKITDLKPENIAYTSEFDETQTCEFFIGDHIGSNLRCISKFTDSENKYSDLWKVWAKMQHKSANSESIKIVNNDSNVCIKDKIIIDDHGKWYEKDKKVDLSEASFYVALESKHRNGILSMDSNGELSWSTDANRFLEAALTKVAILDERIQAWALKNQHQNTEMPMIEACERMGVFIPSAACNLNNYTSIDFNELIGTIILYFESGCRYIVLHHTIFEYLCFKKYGNKELENINKLYNELHKPTNDKYLILLSGLGIPSNLPHNSFFCNLSSLEKVIKERPNKYFLIQYLFALRLTNKKT